MSWKLDENNNIVLKDGDPVYVDANGVEKTVGVDTIARLNNEAKEHRIAKEDALAKLKAYEGIDAQKAREALETVAKLDASKLIDTGEVDKLKSQITQQFQSQLNEKDAAFTELKAKYENMIVDNAFVNSDFIRNNVAVPTDMFEAKFRNNFKVENGDVVAYGYDGSRLMSKTRAGEYATVEEAMQILAESHPQKDIILKANPGSGSGSGTGGGSAGGGRYMKRSDFEKLSPVQQADIANKMRKGEIQLTD
ncbi:MAG: hypothetical protein IJ529_02235 [Alphaproteobacteria bacterium]|nr:hypothetical protein [Alphaproteobacteria bacterium]MBR1599970.1 hypothetical protein [Alphaproteobacteria bacterium]